MDARADLMLEPETIESASSASEEIELEESETFDVMLVQGNVY